MKSSVCKETWELCSAKRETKKFGIKQCVKLLLKWQFDPYKNYSIITITIRGFYTPNFCVTSTQKTVPDCGWSLTEKNKRSGELLEPKH